MNDDTLWFFWNIGPTHPDYDPNRYADVDKAHAEKNRSGENGPEAKFQQYERDIAAERSRSSK